MQTNMTYRARTGQCPQQNRRMDRRTQRGGANVPRRVSNLTVEQIEKKRAIDRDNQRHHRAKNKAYCRQLEQKLGELTSRLRELEDILAQHKHCDARQPNPATTTTLPAVCDVSILPQASMAFESGYGVENDLDSLPLDFGAGMIVNSLNSAQEFSFLDLNLSNPVGGMGATAQTMLPDFSTSSATLTRPGTAIGACGSTLPDWSRMPLHIPPTCKLDEVLQSITAACRSRTLHQGELAEPVFPNIHSLLNRPHNDVRNHSVQRFSDAVAAQVWRSSVESLPERIGFMYNLSHLLRWLICRSKETYDKMPKFLRPTELQRTVPHAAWVDTIVWPEARDAIIRNMDWARFEEFRVLAGLSLTVQWPYDNSTAFIEAPDKQTMLLHPIFEAHIRKAENWKLGKEVKEAFPFTSWDYAMISSW